MCCVYIIIWFRPVPTSESSHSHGSGSKCTQGRITEWDAEISAVLNLLVRATTRSLLLSSGIITLWFSSSSSLFSVLTGLISIKAVQMAIIMKWVHRSCTFNLQRFTCVPDVVLSFIPCHTVSATVLYLLQLPYATLISSSSTMCPEITCTWSLCAFYVCSVTHAASNMKVWNHGVLIALTGHCCPCLCTLTHHETFAQQMFGASVWHGPGAATPGSSLLNLKYRSEEAPGSALLPSWSLWVIDRNECACIRRVCECACWCRFLVHVSMCMCMCGCGMSYAEWFVCICMWTEGGCSHASAQIWLYSVYQSEWLILNCRFTS